MASEKRRPPYDKFHRGVPAVPIMTGLLFGGVMLQKQDFRPDGVTDRLGEFAFERLPVTDAHAWAVRTLPPIHNDPFDRLLVAQAKCEEAAIVSADTTFDGYGVRRLWQR